MKLDFRIDWGYQYLYSRRHYHPTFVWDGNLSCKNGEILESYQLTYPVIWFGPGHCAKETKLEKPEWESKTKRGFAGVRFVAEVTEDTEFVLTTASGTFTFTAADILEKQHFTYLVGPKYLGCYVNVIKTGYYWFRDADEGKTVYDANDLGLPVYNWARMHLAWLRPENTVEFTYDVPDDGKDVSETLIHLVAMGVPEYNPEKETQVFGELPFELYCDGEFVKTFKKFYRKHDGFMQLLEDDWVRVSVAPGKHTFAIKNKHAELCLGISQIKLSQHGFMHGQLSIPEWALKGERMVGKVFAAREDAITVNYDGGSVEVACKEGWNEFVFTADVVGNMKFATANSETVVEVFDIEEEKNPVKVGYDMTVVPHDENGFMDWLLDYTARTRLSNYVVFRNFRSSYEKSEFDTNLLRGWAEYCKDHGIYVSACTDYLDGAVVEGAGDMFNDCGLHEYPGRVYAFDPKEPYASQDMKEAAEHYMDFLKIEIDKAHAVSNCVAFGDASGGIRYSFLAGVDFVRAETMVGHTQVLLAQTRPAAEALGEGRWGVHIAIQHGYQPYRESHMGQYFLSLMQPWMMGAEAIYEEDCLFLLFKEERQAWDDQLTKGKRDMTRNFFKFAKTHPRKGTGVRNIAFLEGRYAAPFNGFICDVEQDPHYAVWGLFGNNAPEWGHDQPEKCRQILDVLMPGACTMPFRQKFEKRRFYFSGTPYGDFDCVPVEAGQDYINGYKLLLNLGWNTMIAEDYDKLKSYVEEGGVLLTGIPQFSTHLKRDFLKDMEDLALWNDGDIRDLCGISVEGKGEKYSGQWNCEGRYDKVVPELSAMPSDDVDEDGVPYLADVKLCGAQVVAWDSATGKPMLVKYPVGKGWVYTFTLWAYPGHEQYQTFCATWVKELAKESLPEVYVEDPSEEVFWTRWVDGEKEILMLLNTDWTEQGNVKQAAIVSGDKRWDIEVKERVAMVAEVCGDQLTINEYTL